MTQSIRNTLRVLMCSVPFWGCAGSANSAPKDSIRVMSYNIHHGAGLDGRLDLARIAGVIRAASPDIVSLQEVDNQTRRSQGIDQAQELARLTNMDFVYGASLDLQGGKYGNAVLTKLAIRKSKVIPLPGEPRSALCVTLKNRGKDASAEEFLFIATHLDTQSMPQLSSVPLIDEIFVSQPNVPTILAADLNATPNSPTLQAFGKAWVNATAQEGFFTYPAKKPSCQIDYVLCRPSRSWKVMEAHVLTDTIASDHRPILAVLQFLPKPDI